MLKSFLKQYNRPFICICLVVVIMLCFFARLADWQLIQGDYYREEVATTANYKVYSDATRGEILDVNGVALETNTTLYSVIIDKLYIPTGTSVNEVIAKLFEIFTACDEKWIDTLPIYLDKDGVFQFKEAENSAERNALYYLQSEDFLDLGVYAGAEEYMEELSKRYDLEQYTDKALLRDMVSVRFNMDMNMFSSTNPYTFAQNISPELTAIISEFSQSMPCIDIKTVSERVCTDGDLMPHILGITGPLTAEEYEEYKDKGYNYDDVIGKFGIEAAMEEELRGEGGTKVIAKSSDGTVIDVVDIVPAKPGNTVYLTVDSKLQEVAGKALKENVTAAQKAGKADSLALGEKYQGEDCVAGAVVMLDVKTFGVLAAATYPTYDITKYNEGDYYMSLIEDDTLPLYDRAFQGAFAPGSVVKPAVALAALEEDIISEVTSINCTKTYDYYPSNVVNCMGYHGYLGVTEAISKSCNYYFAEVGRRLGIETMYLYMEKMGLGEKTGLEITESSGVLAGRDSATWLPGNTVQAAIGQSDNTFTPVQLATYCATIANNGTRLRTHLVDKITTYDRKTVLSETTEENAEVVEKLNVDAYNLKVVQNAMRTVATDGTASYMFASYPVDIAAKTGTAENPGSDHTSFICYAPYDDPQVAIAVVIEHGASGIYSASVAKALLDAYFFPETLETTAPVETTAPAVQ